MVLFHRAPLGRQTAINLFQDSSNDCAPSRCNRPARAATLHARRFELPK